LNDLIKKLEELERSTHHQGYADGDSGDFYRTFTYEEWSLIGRCIAVYKDILLANNFTKG
jgi:hypothetical protein